MVQSAEMGLGMNRAVGHDLSGEWRILPEG